MLNKSITSEQRHVGSRRFTCHPTQVHAPHLTSAKIAILD